MAASMSVAGVSLRVRPRSGAPGSARRRRSGRRAPAPSKSMKATRPPTSKTWLVLNEPCTAPAAWPARWARRDSRRRSSSTRAAYCGYALAILRDEASSSSSSSASPARSELERRGVEGGERRRHGSGPRGQIERAPVLRERLARQHLLPDDLALGVVRVRLRDPQAAAATGVRWPPAGAGFPTPGVRGPPGRPCRRSGARAHRRGLPADPVPVTAALPRHVLPDPEPQEHELPGGKPKRPRLAAEELGHGIAAGQRRQAREVRIVRVGPQHHPELVDTGHRRPELGRRQARRQRPPEEGRRLRLGSDLGEVELLAATSVGGPQRGLKDDAAAPARFV